MIPIVVLLLGLAVQTWEKSFAPNDFALRLTGSCSTFNRIDTSTKEYTREIGRKSVSARVELTNAERLRILDAANAAEFFTMEGRLEAPFDPAALNVTPSSSFELHITAHGRRNKVTANNSTQPPGPAIKRFLELVRVILDVYENRREVRRLPESTVVCR